MSHAGWIYVLHFDSKLHHAQHYIGATTHLPERLRCHAHGHGSCLTSALRKNCIGWRVGGLYQCHSRSSMWRLERQAKSSHQGSRYCGLCSGPDQSPLPGSTLTDPSVATVLTRSVDYSPFQENESLVYHVATEEDVQPIIWLMSMEIHAVGFIPAGGVSGMNRAISRRRVLGVYRDNSMVGYILWGITRNPEMARIWQIIVHDLIRFRGVGAELVSQAESAAIANHAFTMSAHVRIDLAANEFWKRLLYQDAGQYFHKTSGNRITVYHKPLTSEALTV